MMLYRHLLWYVYTTMSMFQSHQKSVMFCVNRLLLCPQATGTLDGGEAASQRSGITSGLSEVSFASLSQQSVQQCRGPHVVLACSSILKKVMRHSAKTYLIHFRSGPARKSAATMQRVIAASAATMYAGLASALQVLWGPQPCLCCQVFDNRQVVLQWAHHWNSLMHHYSPGTI